MSIFVKALLKVQNIGNYSSLVEIRISQLKRSMSLKETLLFNDPNISEALSTIHDKYAVVPADKFPNNIVLTCNKHIRIEIRLDSLQGNPT